jgi:ATP-dependent protease ClpP protease subunit
MSLHEGEHMKFSWICLLAAGFLAAAAQGDTFTHRTTKKVYHGYATQTVNESKTLVHTAQEGPLELNLAEFDIIQDANGRNNTVAVIAINDQIGYELETDAFEKALIAESNKGPLFILIEIDSPGGRIDLARRICAAIGNTRNCRTVAFVRGGSVGGAYSAAAAVALACNEIYMVPASSIGAATAIARAEGHSVDIKEAYGEAIGEKIGSVWRNYLAALAQQNNRPGLLAKAMEDRMIEVLEVKRGGKSIFIEAHEKAPGDQVVRICCKKGELLTLPSSDAVAYKIADGTVDSRDDLLKHLNVGDAAVTVNSDVGAAKDELEKVINRFNKLNAALDSKYKELGAKVKTGALTKSVAVKDFQALIKNAEYLLKLKKTYPDVPVSEESLEDFLSDIKATHEAIRAMR